MDPHRLIADTGRLLRQPALTEDWRRAVFDRLTSLEGLCEGGLAAPASIDPLRDALGDWEPSGDAFTCLQIWVHLATCYLLALAPDEADQIVSQCRERLADADLDSGRHDLIAAQLRQLSELLGYGEGDPESAIEYAVLTSDAAREAFLRGLSSDDRARAVRDTAQRDLADLSSLIDACDPATPGSVEALREALAGRTRPAELCAYGWFVLAASLGRPEERDARQAAIGQAYHFIGPVQTAQISLLGKLQLLSSYHHIECGDLRRAREEYENAAASFFALRNAAADPMLRPQFTDQEDWADDLVRMGYDTESGELLFGVLAGLQAHGLVEALSDSTSGSGAERESTRSLIQERLRTSWEPTWFWPQQVAATLPDGVGLLQVFRGYDHDGYVVSQLLTRDSLMTKKANLSDRLVERVFPLSARSVVRLRKRDWLALSTFVLPDELLDGSQAIDRLIVAPGEGVAALPFASLRTDAGSLGDGVEIVTLPHLRLWKQARPSAVPFRHVCAVGCDSSEDADRGVVGFNEEMDALGALGVSVTRADSIGVLERSLPEVDALILGLHGRVAVGENVLLFPNGHDVAAVDLASLPLPALVIAAACWSGGLHASPSPFTLVPACLFGGAQDLVVTLWDADSMVLSATLIELYGALAAGLSLPSALRVAQSKIGGISPLAAVCV